jgi:hypothetical protein
LAVIGFRFEALLVSPPELPFFNPMGSSVVPRFNVQGLSLGRSRDLLRPPSMA